MIIRTADGLENRSVVTGTLIHFHWCLSGPFQPSNDMMLRFYSFYKQATLGPCDIPRPGFWDAVGKAKW